MFKLERIFQTADAAKDAGLIPRFAEGVKTIAPFEFDENPDCPLLYTLDAALTAACEDQGAMNSLTRVLPEILDARSERWKVKV